MFFVQLFFFVAKIAVTNNFFRGSKVPSFGTKNWALLAKMPVFKCPIELGFTFIPFEDQTAEMVLILRKSPHFSILL